MKFVPFLLEYLVTMVGDSISNIHLYSDSSDEESSVPREENPLPKNDTLYDPRYFLRRNLVAFVFIQDTFCLFYCFEVVMCKGCCLFRFSVCKLLYFSFFGANFGF